jgi:squalene-associated FAD-dependent desaturase
MAQTHVIGAGLAGLAAALTLSKAGRPVTLYEAGPAAGGRCRSYFDRELDLAIDNGNHLLLSGNTAARAYIDEIGSLDRFNIPKRPAIPFVDVKRGLRWVVRPSMGRIPWWILRSDRGIPETRLADFMELRQVSKIKNDTTVADSMRRGWLYWRLVEPLAVAALNTPAREGLARLLGVVLRETLMRGGKYCLPMTPKQHLSDALIDPAIAALQARGAAVHFNHRIAAVETENGRIVSLRGPDGAIAVEQGDSVVLAVPPWVAADLLPGLTAPDSFESILNIHFKGQADPDGPLGVAGLIGIISGTAEWLFAKPGHVSVTISAANGLVDEAPATIAQMVWPNVVDAMQLPAEALNAMPAFRVIKEKRATFAANLAQERRRPKTATKLATNVALAGDWTDTGLPATIEGAIGSGRAAGAHIISL